MSKYRIVLRRKRVLVDFAEVPELYETNAGDKDVIQYAVSMIYSGGYSEVSLDWKELTTSESMDLDGYHVVEE